MATQTTRHQTAYEAADNALLDKSLDILIKEKTL
jgi:hypothetical protein